MAKLNIENTRNLLQQFEFRTLFVEELGWSNPSIKKTQSLFLNGFAFELQHIAQLGGAVVVEVTSGNGEIPDAKTRAAIHKEFSKQHLEHLLIFLNKKRTQSLWYWVKREEKKNIPRDHVYVKGQPGDLFLSKLSSMVIDIGAFDEHGEVSIVEAVQRLKRALDVEATTKSFYKEYDDFRVEFVELIDGIDDARERKWYASVLLNRLMFIYFLQKKLFLDNGDDRYLQRKLEESKKRGNERFYSEFLKLLFFEGFAKPKVDEATRELIGSIKYLNGGLFIEHSIEEKYGRKIKVPDKAFENLFKLFGKYSWHLDDTPGGNDNEINPDVLGYIFEKYINQKEFGAYYTRPEITQYLCEITISKLILEKVNAQGFPGIKREVTSLSDLLLDLNAPLCKFLLDDALPNLSLLDPACGSGAFLVAAMKSLINVYAAIIGKIEFLGDYYLTNKLKLIQRDHKSIAYFIKKRIITDNLFGVDIMEEATEIAKLRLFLALVAAARSVDDLEPLPNVDFNILAGNSLIGLMKIEKKAFEESSDLITQSYYNTYIDAIRERNILVGSYRHASIYAEDLRSMRDDIRKKDDQVNETLHHLLLDQFQVLGIKYEEATWDAKKDKEGKVKNRPLKLKDITDLHPFHWGFEFDEIVNKRGGFDAIITNPPWEIFKPQAKEFFVKHSDIVTKNTMSIKDFEKEQDKLLKNPEIRKAWLGFLSDFPYVSAYYRMSPQYKNQISIVKGKKAGSDINLYKLFLEQCFNLLRPGGHCGIVVPTGIYTDLGTKQLRQLLFDETEIEHLIGLSNERNIFEGVMHNFKFCLLTFSKSAPRSYFRAAFRIYVHEAISPDELESFLESEENKVSVSVDLVKRFAPDSLSVLEYKNTN